MFYENYKPYEIAEQRAIEDLDAAMEKHANELKINTDIAGRPLDSLYPEHIVRIFKLMDTWLVELVDGNTYSCGVSPSSNGIMYLSVNIGFPSCVEIKISVKEIQKLIEGDI